MKTILVANAKGGAGKTTLATNIAGGLAARGAPVTLWDLDRQKSALQWLAVRPESLPGIAQLGDGRDDPAKPKGKGWLIIDSPAGLHGKTLARAIKLSHRVRVIWQRQANSCGIWWRLSRTAAARQGGWVSLACASTLAHGLQPPSRHSSDSSGFPC